MLQNVYAELFIDLYHVAVTLSFRQGAHRVHIPFSAISRILNATTGVAVDVPAVRMLSDFRTAFSFAFATLMTFHWGTQASETELEGRAIFALLPALLTRIVKGTSADAAQAVIVFRTDVPGVSLPPQLVAMNQSKLSITLAPGDRDARIRASKIMVQCEGPDGENWIMIPFTAVQEIVLSAPSMALPVFPGPIADPLPDTVSPQRTMPGAGLDLDKYGAVTSPSRFPPGSFVANIWEAGKFCLSGYVGRHSIPGLRFPKELHERVPLGPSTTLEILVFDEPRHNAVAFRRGAHYCVGLYHGLITTIPEFAMALWTRPDVASWIGDVSRLPPPPPAGDFPDGLAGLEFQRIMTHREFDQDEAEAFVAATRVRQQRAIRLTSALDPVRRMAMQQCIVDAFRYIWLHEIGHVVWGHVDLVERSSGSLGMSEIDDACGDEFPAELGQFLEFQTDRFAFGSVLNYRIGDLQKASGRGELGAPERGLPVFVDQASIAITGAVVAQLVLAANLRFQGRDDVASTHPPVWFRVMDMITEANETFAALELDGPETPAEIEGRLHQSMNDAVGSIVRTHPMLSEVFLATEGDAGADNRRYIEAFYEAIPQWDAVVRPYFKFHRGENELAALRD